MCMNGYGTYSCVCRQCSVVYVSFIGTYHIASIIHFRPRKHCLNFIKLGRTSNRSQYKSQPGKSVCVIESNVFLPSILYYVLIIVRLRRIVMMNLKLKQLIRQPSVLPTLGCDSLVSVLYISSSLGECGIGLLMFNMIGA